MTKEELIYRTLKQLSENLKSSPENFRLEDTEIGTSSKDSYPGPTIIWQFKVKLKEDTYIQDPLNATRTIIVYFNKMARQMTCLIYFREVSNINHSIVPDSQVMFQCYEWPTLNRTYRQFMKLRKSLINQRNEKEFLDYMKKLNNIFPSTHEDDIFK